MLLSPPVQLMTERGNGGRFAKGSSGNRRGRPKSRSRRLETPEDLEEVIIDVMNMPVRVSGEETVSLFRATLLRLTTGAIENPIAARHALQLMTQATVSRSQRIAEEKLR